MTKRATKTSQRSAIVDGTDRSVAKLVAGSDQAVVLNFWARWSVPSRAMEASLANIAASDQHEFVLVRVNVDDCPNAAEAFGVKTIPAVVVCVGERRHRREGFLSAQRLQKWFDEMIG